MECPKDSRYRRYQLDLIRPVFTCLSSSGSTVTRRPRLRACLHHLGYDKAVDVDNAGSKISGSLVISAASGPACHAHRALLPLTIGATKHDPESFEPVWQQNSRPVRSERASAMKAQGSSATWLIYVSGKTNWGGGATPSTIRAL